MSGKAARAKEVEVLVAERVAWETQTQKQKKKKEKKPGGFGSIRRPDRRRPPASPFLGKFPFSMQPMYHACAAALLSCSMSPIT